MEELTIDTDLIHIITKEQACFYRVFPEEAAIGSLSFYCESGIDTNNLREELEFVLDKKIILTPIEVVQLNRLLSQYYLNEGQDTDQLMHDPSSDDFLETLISEAKKLKSSDIHLETYEQKCRVRIRIDGMLIEKYMLNKLEYPSIVNKIKILANLDIAEKRLPQDGRINFKTTQHQFDIRVSVLPTLYGEKIVLRLLNNDAAPIDLHTLGFAENDLNNYLEGLKRPNGILLISGPTGSGKTTTLYATLKLLNKNTRNILTIEDPIEYTLDGINQVQLKENIGLTFGAALRTFLRQDPDVIMIGEIRDPETANMAIRAALTGHLVLSTIHTNSAWGTVSRLMDMGIPPFLVASTLNTSVAQRLVRMLCPYCKAIWPLEKKLYPRNYQPAYLLNHHWLPKGCEHCFYTGYKGRKAVYEVLPIDHELAAGIKEGNLDISLLLKERGIRTLGDNAFELLASGLTSLEEVYPLLSN